MAVIMHIKYKFTSSCSSRVGARFNGMTRVILKFSYLMLIVLIIPGVYGCASEADFTGEYRLQGGDCSSKIIDLKKVSGFGEKYYLIYIDEGSVSSFRKEFLGVIDKKMRNRLIIYSGTRLNRQEMNIEGYIIISGNQLSVKTTDKTCAYSRVILKEP
jgi:hypothetical protein